MTKLLLILFVFCAVSAIKSQERKITVQPGEGLSAEKRALKNGAHGEVLKVEDVLGKQWPALISGARQIRLFQVREFVTDPLPAKSRKKYFAGYEIVKSAKLTRQQLKGFKQILLEANNYETPELLNKCTFTANVGIEFKVGRKTAKAVFSYACGQMLFLENNGELYRGVHSAAAFDRLARVLFKDLPAIENKSVSGN